MLNNNLIALLSSSSASRLITDCQRLDDEEQHVRDRVCVTNYLRFDDVPFTQPQSDLFIKSAKWGLSVLWSFIFWLKCLPWLRPWQWQAYVQISSNQPCIKANLHWGVAGVAAHDSLFVLLRPGVAEPSRARAQNYPTQQNKQRIVRGYSWQLLSEDCPQQLIPRVGL